MTVRILYTNWKGEPGSLMPEWKIPHGWTLKPFPNDTYALTRSDRTRDE